MKPDELHPIAKPVEDDTAVKARDLRQEMLEPVTRIVRRAMRPRTRPDAMVDHIRATARRVTAVVGNDVLLDETALMARVVVCVCDDVVEGRKAQETFRWLLAETVQNEHRRLLACPC